MKLLSFIIIFIAGTVIVSAQHDRNVKAEPSASQNISNIDSAYVQGFADAFENFTAGNEGEYLMYYFTPEEADRFTISLMEAEYPEVDGELSAEIMNRSEVVRQRMEIIASTCNETKITYIEKRLGHTDALDGLLVQFAFGKEDEWKEQISILFTVFESKLKVLSVKDEK